MVSIIIPNYNGNAYLEDCIQSVFKHEKIKIELIIIDNASTDNNYKWIKEKYPDIIWKQLNKNYGFSYAVNEGIRLAKGDYVILLNNDTIICDNFVEELYKQIQQNNKIFAVCSKMIQYQDRDKIDDAGDEYNLLGWAYKCGDGQAIEKYLKTRQVFSACAGAAIYRKAIFEKIGYFDESFFAYMEDVDISYRALIHGYKNIYCPDAKVYHIGSATSGSKYNSFKVRLAARNNIYVPYKNMPLIQLFINIPFLLTGFLIKYIFFIKKGFGGEYREGAIEGLKNLHKVEKVKFEWKNLFNYIYIESLLIKNTVTYIFSKLKRA